MDAAETAPRQLWLFRGDRVQTWQTPMAFFLALHVEYGFDLDGAATAETALLPEFSAPDAPVSWEGRRVFCNPPWSNIAPFLEEAATAAVAVLLVPARTNAGWWHRALALGARVRYFQGRLEFQRGSQGGRGNPADCVLLVFGEK